MSQRDDSAMVLECKTSFAHREEAINKLPVELQSGAHKLNEKLEETKHGLNKILFDMGMIVKEEWRKIAPKGETQGESHYGDHAVEQWAKAIKIPARTLYTCLRVSQLYTREEFMRLVDRGLTWTHFLYLVSIENDEERHKLEDRIISEKLSVSALSEEIQQAHGNRRKGSGRSPALPRNLPHALLRLKKASNTYGNVLGMLTDEYDFYRAFAETCPDEWSEEMYAQIGNEISTLDQIAATSRELSDGLREANDRGLQILEKRREKTIEATFEEVVEVEPRVVESQAIIRPNLALMDAVPMKKKALIASDKPRSTPKALAQNDKVPVGQHTSATGTDNGANPECAKPVVVSEGRPKVARRPLITN